MRLRFYVERTGFSINACNEKTLYIVEAEDYVLIVCDDALQLSSTLPSDKNYSANNTINSTQIINSPLKSNYKAGKNITLNNGFQAQVRTVFKAEIGGRQ